MKKIVLAILAIILVGVIGFIGLNAFNSPKNTSKDVQVQQNSDQNVNVEVKTTNKITLAEVEKHNTASDCWQIINGKVYNATEIAKTHKNSAELIFPLCGKDSTTAFTTRNGFGPHPDKATEKLSSFYLGDLQQ